jgi:hypothetical protein
MRERRERRFFELYVYTLGDSRDRREGNDAQGKAMRRLRVLRAMVISDNFGKSRCAAHEDGEGGVLYGHLS